MWLLAHVVFFDVGSDEPYTYMLTHLAHLLALAHGPGHGLLMSLSYAESCHRLSVLVASAVIPHHTLGGHFMMDMTVRGHGQNLFLEVRLAGGHRRWAGQSKQGHHRLIPPTSRAPDRKSVV